MIYAIAFFSIFFKVLCFGFYTKSIQLNKEIVASNWSIGISLANILTIVSAIEDLVAIPFILAGAWFGTYLSVIINLRRNREQNTLFKT